MNKREIEYELNRRHDESYSYRTIGRTLPKLVESGLIRKPDGLSSYEITEFGKRYLRGNISEKEAEMLAKFSD